MISEEYRALNAELHANRTDYGKFSSRWAPLLFVTCSEYETEDVLDYGCGKGSLNLHMPFSIKQYDPAVTKWSSPPEPADIVVCTDVLEHVEPEFVRDVIADLTRVTKKCLLLNVSTRLAKKTLSDGRNAHISVHDYHWWKERLIPTFTFSENDIERNEDEFTVLLLPRVLGTENAA